MENITIVNWAESSPITMLQPVEVFTEGKTIFLGALSSLCRDAIVSKYYLAEQPVWIQFGKFSLLRPSTSKQCQTLIEQFLFDFFTKRA